jgi:hypothetical protein
MHPLDLWLIRSKDYATNRPAPASSALLRSRPGRHPPPHEGNLDAADPLPPAWTRPPPAPICGHHTHTTTAIQLILTFAITSRWRRPSPRPTVLATYGTRVQRSWCTHRPLLSMALHAIFARCSAAVQAVRSTGPPGHNRDHAGLLTSSLVLDCCCSLPPLDCCCYCRRLIACFCATGKNVTTTSRSVTREASLFWFVTLMLISVFLSFELFSFIEL